MNSKHVLIVGSAKKTSLEKMYLRAFLSSGYPNTDLLNIESSRSSWSKNRIVNRLLPDLLKKWGEKELLNHLRINNDKYHYIIIFKGLQFTRKSLEKCRSITPVSTWINIYTDDPYNFDSRAATNSNVVDSFSFFDAYCIWSKSIENRLRLDGCKKVIYLPFGYDVDHHRLCNTPTEGDPTLISFIGTWDRRREKLLAELKDYNIMIYGTRWENVKSTFPHKKNIVYKSVSGNEASCIMKKSAISLNPMRLQNQGAHNMRTFEIPAMGGLMLTNKTEEQQYFFPHNEACYMYTDIEDLKITIDRILNNKDKANIVRDKGIKVVIRHSYSNRVQSLIKELEEKSEF